MHVELALVLVAAGGLVAAALIGAAVAFIVSKRLIYRRLATRGDSPAGTAVRQAVAPAAASGAVPGPEPSFKADAPAAQPSATRAVPAGSSALPEAPWDQEAGTLPAASSFAGTEPAAFSLPETSWDQKASTPPAPTTPQIVAPVASSLPPDAWDQETRPSPPAPSDIPIPGGADLTQNGAGRHDQRLSIENNAASQGPDKPVSRRSDSSGTNGSWGDLPTERGTDDVTGWGSSREDRPSKPGQN